jgi:cellulose synthase operon protein C
MRSVERKHVDTALGYFCSPFALLLTLCAIATSHAQEIDYDAARPAALRRCDDSLLRGRVDPARNCYRPLLKSSDALIRAEAAWALGDLRGANELFRDATNNNQSVRARVRWGRLYIAAGQYPDAIKLFQEALQINKNDVSARLAMLRVAAERFDGDVTEPLSKLLTENGNLIEAHLIAAGVAIERSDLTAASTSARKALELTEQQKLPPLEAHTLLAAIEVVGNRDPEEWSRAALAYNPRYGKLFEQLGHFEIIRRRYQQADDWLAKAVTVQPDLWSARRERGLNLLRLAKLPEAREQLVKAYEGDPFSAATVNTLRLLDSLSQFDVINVQQPPLRLQLNKKESAVLKPYVEELASKAIATLSSRYGYTPARTDIEFYPNHDDFAVRTAGLPGIGLLGVTFGDVVAMDSPSGRQSGDFHWGSTLWHEMAHVFTLGATKHRVPRWLSEGLSVFEEWTTGPTRGVVIAPNVLNIFADNKFLPIEKLDDGFMRPTYENQVQMSYMQAGLICLFAEQRFGFARVVEFLHAFDGDVTTAMAVRSVFKLEPEQFDKEFNQFMKQRFAAYLADPKHWENLLTRAHETLKAHQWADARKAARAAIPLLPEYTDKGNAYEVFAAAEEGAGNPAAAIEALLQWRKAGGWAPALLRKLGTLLIAAHRDAEAAEVLAAVNYVDPFVIDGHHQLGQLLLNQQRGPEALREYQVLLALQPLDTAAGNYGLARAYRATGDHVNARRHLLESLDTAPNYRPAQKLLLEILGDQHK